MNGCDMPLLSFIEDDFDLDEFKKAAQARVQAYNYTQYPSRSLIIGKLLIIILAFFSAYWLYNLASQFIEQYDYNRYHNVEYHIGE